MAPVLRAEGLAVPVGPGGSGGDSGWSPPGWVSVGERLMESEGTGARGTLCHGQFGWRLHPGDQTRLEVAAGP